MRIRFTKMQGAGNDFVVLDRTTDQSPGRLNLSPAHYRWLADRHFGVGADQILSVLPSPAPGVDFAYKIHNADGGEVEHCGNGARCFLAYVRGKNLTAKSTVAVQTQNRLLQLTQYADGQVCVNMQKPVFELAALPFQPELQPGVWESVYKNEFTSWNIPKVLCEEFALQNRTIFVSLVSIGNPHAVLLVDDVDSTRVAQIGPGVQQQAAFTHGVNVGFLQIQNRRQAKLRVYERGTGETLACGTGACAAVVCGIRLGLLDATVQVQTRGGLLTVAWAGGDASVTLTGPATFVFDAEIDLPDDL